MWGFFFTSSLTSQIYKVGTLYTLLRGLVRINIDINGWMGYKVGSTERNKAMHIYGLHLFEGHSGRPELKVVIAENASRARSLAKASDHEAGAEIWMAAIVLWSYPINDPKAVERVVHTH